MNLIFSSNFLFGSKKLQGLTKIKGKKMKRRDPKLNIEIEIYVSTYKHKLGLCFFYENLTTDKRMEESLIIDGIGVEIANIEVTENNGIVFDLNPGETRFIQIKAKKINWSVKSYVSYKIESI